jgi:O-methyltransferase involved in polyketide biosynthesis
MRLPLRRGSDAISPTAHYTGHVWGRRDLSHPELATAEGRLLYGVLSPAMTFSRVLGGPTIEGLLLARHRVIDELLAEAIDSGRVTQVIEAACGMSPRGWRFSERYGERLTYVEADLPGMADRKRRALARMGADDDRHRVVELDALRDSGPQSLASVAAELDPDAGLAIITEGLLTYFREDDVVGMWRRFATVLAGFPDGLYLADIHLGEDGPALTDRAFRALLSTFVRGPVSAHFEGERGALQALRDAGFAEARVTRADRHPAAGDARRDPGATRIHIVEATTQLRVR